MIFAISLLWAALLPLHSCLDDQPRLQLGGTVLIGSHIQSSNVDFFGGHTFSHYYLISSESSPLDFQVSLLPSLQLANFDFLLLALSILFLPCNHLMPVATVSRAYSQ